MILFNLLQFSLLFFPSPSFIINILLLQHHLLLNNNKKNLYYTTISSEKSASYQYYSLFLLSLCCCCFFFFFFLLLLLLILWWSRRRLLFFFFISSTKNIDICISVVFVIVYITIINTPWGWDVLMPLFFKYRGFPRVTVFTIHHHGCEHLQRTVFSTWILCPSKADKFFKLFDCHLPKHFAWAAIHWRVPNHFNGVLNF